MTLNEQIKSALSLKKVLVKRPARGFIKHDYLVPGGPYEEQWDWDAFFVGMSLASEISSEAIYLKNWALNYLEHVHADGCTPGLLTPRGIDNRLKHIKPFLAQGCLFASRFLKDFEWIRPHWSALKRSVVYREKTYYDKRRGLASWYNSMESGADNNVSVLDFPIGSVIATDLNTFLYREFKAVSLIASKLGYTRDALGFRKKANLSKKNILKYLWDEKDVCFYNLDKTGQSMIKRIGYSNLVPLWGKIASVSQGRRMIRKYLLNPRKLWARYGVRTLAADDPQYNQANIIKPYSNWQGPVWPIANYLAMHALLNYGFKREARQLADKIATVCLNDINKSGGMHENYNADTGRALAAPNFVSWNLLVGRMIDEAETGVNPFEI